MSRKVQYRTEQDGVWWDLSTSLNPGALFHMFESGEWRTEPAKPEPKRVPLEESDLPPFFWVRIKYGTSDCWLDPRMPIQIWGNGLILMADEGGEFKAWTFEELKDNGAEYSVDRREWKPFWKEES